MILPFLKWGQYPGMGQCDPEFADKKHNRPPLVLLEFFALELNQKTLVQLLLKTIKNHR